MVGAGRGRRTVRVDRIARLCATWASRLASRGGPRKAALRAGGSVLSAFASAFRTPDLRKKLLFTLALIGLYRLGASVPTPGVSTKGIQACTKVVNNGSDKNVYSLINLFSGGALLRLSVF